MDNDDTSIDIIAELEKIELHFSLKSGDIFRLYQSQNDWAFVIICNALVETAICEVLKNIFDERLTKTITYLPLYGRGSKIELLRESKTIPKYYISFAERLLTLRNKLAHDANNLNFSLRRYVGEMKEGIRKQYIKESTNWISNDALGPDEKKYSPEDFSVRFPKETFLFGTIKWLVVMDMSRRSDELQKEIALRERQLLHNASRFADIFLSQTA